MHQFKAGIPLVVGLVCAVVLLLYPEAKLIACKTDLFGF